MINVKQIFIDGNKGDVDVKIFINSNGQFIMCPYGRSGEKKWIGMAKLNYFKTGDYNKIDRNEFVSEIVECINVGANYDKMNIERCSGENDLVTHHLKEAKKNKYYNYHVISVNLSDINDNIEVVEWERVGNSGNEWRGNPDTVKTVEYNEIDKLLFETINSFIEVN